MKSDWKSKCQSYLTDLKLENDHQSFSKNVAKRSSLIKRADNSGLVRNMTLSHLPRPRQCNSFTMTSYTNLENESPVVWWQELHVIRNALSNIPHNMKALYKKHNIRLEQLNVKVTPMEEAQKRNSMFCSSLEDKNLHERVSRAVAPIQLPPFSRAPPPRRLPAMLNNHTNSHTSFPDKSTKYSLFRNNLVEIDIDKERKRLGDMFSGTVQNMIYDLERYLVKRLNETVSTLQDRYCVTYFSWQIYKRQFTAHLHQMKSVKIDDGLQSSVATLNPAIVPKSPSDTLVKSYQDFLPTFIPPAPKAVQLPVTQDVYAAIGLAKTMEITKLTEKSVDPLEDTDIAADIEKAAVTLKLQMMQSTRKNEREMEIRRFKVTRMAENDIPKGFDTTLANSLGLAKLEFI